MRSFFRLDPERSTIVFVFVLLAVLFGLTSVIARKYHQQRAGRGRDFYTLGAKLDREGRTEEAIEEYRNALATSSDLPECRLALAQALMTLGRDAEAATYLHELLRAHPSAAVPNLLLARLAERAHSTPDAVEYLERAIYGRWPADAGKLPLQARWQLVGLLEKRGARRETIAQLLEIAGQPGIDAAMRRRAASALLAFNAPNEAAEVYRDLLRETPRDPDAEAGLGDAQVALGDYAAAQRAFRRALAADPHHAAASRGIALVDEVLMLDPTRRGLTTRARHQRTRTLIERASQILDVCLAGREAPPPVVDALHRAQSALKQPASDEAAESNLALAEELWSLRGDVCSLRVPPDPALAEVLAKVAK